MARRDGRMTAKEERETARSLRKSLESTHQGLQLLLESLKRSGFDKAVDSYGQMQLVLMQQRLWSRGYRRNELNPLWKQIAETAGRIHDILAPFARVMGSLEQIDRVEAVEEVADQPSPPEQAAPAGEQPSHAQSQQDPLARELAGLLADGLVVSRARITRGAPAGKDAQTRLRALVTAGVLEPHGWGRSRSYRLAEGSRQQLVDALAALLQGEQNLE